MREHSPLLPWSTRLSISIGLFTTLLLLAPSASAQVLTNGSFDVLVPSNGTGGGWTSANVDGAGGWRADNGNPGARFILNDSGGGTDPTLTQTITGLLAGSTYQVTGSFGTALIGQNTGATQAFGVAIDGVFLFESPGIFQDTDYHPLSFNFVAPGPSVTLLVAAERNGTDNDFEVDSFAITLLGNGGAGVAPEPGTLGLVACGLLGLAGIARRRRE